jgi:2,4-dienoyl-CoA reductase-like NADH-dependent reductase (Old Yellow Enzyme family)
LLDPLTIHSLKLKNRIVMPPMAFGLSNERGEVTEKMIKHYSARCRSLGLLIVEATNMSTSGRMFNKQLDVSEERNVQGFTRLVETLHGQDCTVAIQLVHAGGAASKELVGKTLAPSPIMVPKLYEGIPSEMTHRDIDDIVDDFVYSAGRAKEAGFDAVEVHGDHGYLLNQFLSPITNHRVDEYGGSILNKIKVSLRAVEGIKRDLGSKYPLLYRLGVEDILPEGLTLREGVEAAKLLAQHDVDVMDVSGGVGTSLGWLDKQSGLGFLMPQAAAVKAAVGVPVIGVGGIKTAAEADFFIGSGAVDLVAVGRAILNDPLWAKKAIEELSSK